MSATDLEMACGASSVTFPLLSQHCISRGIGPGRVPGPVLSLTFNQSVTIHAALAISRSSAGRGPAQDEFRRSTADHSVVQARSTKALRQAPVRAAGLTDLFGAAPDKNLTRGT